MDKEKQIMKNSLEAAVNDGDIEKIKEILDNFEADISFENPKTFAGKIKQIEKGDKNNMKKKVKLTRAAFIAAAIVVISCVSASAAYVFNTYVVEKDNMFYSVSSDRELDEKEISDLIDETQRISRESSEKTTESDYESFKSIEEAEKKYDMSIVMPEAMPELELGEIVGIQYFMENNSKTSTVWLEYGNAEDRGFGITVTKNDLSDGTTSVSGNQMDEGSLTGYKSAKGYDFKVFNESSDDNEKTAKIAYIAVGKYEYSAVFFGFEESEINRVIDSLDFETYK